LSWGGGGGIFLVFFFVFFFIYVNVFIFDIGVIFEEGGGGGGGGILELNFFVKLDIQAGKIEYGCSHLFMLAIAICNACKTHPDGAEGWRPWSTKLPLHHSGGAHGLLIRRRVHPARAGGQHHVRVRPRHPDLVRPRRRHGRRAPAARRGDHGGRGRHGVHVRRAGPGAQGAERALRLRHGDAGVDAPVLLRRRAAAPELPLHGGGRGGRAGVRVRRVRRRRAPERPVGVRRGEWEVGGAAVAGGGVPPARRAGAGSRRREGVGGVRVLRRGDGRRALLRPGDTGVGCGGDHGRQAEPTERVLRRRDRAARRGVWRRGGSQRPRTPRRRQVLGRGVRARHGDPRVDAAGGRRRQGGGGGGAAAAPRATRVVRVRGGGEGWPARAAGVWRQLADQRPARRHLLLRARS